LRITYINIFFFVILAQLLAQSQPQKNQLLENSNQQQLLDLRKTCSKDFKEKNVMLQPCIRLISAYGLQISTSYSVDESLKLPIHRLSEISATCASSSQSSKLSEECSKNIQSIIISFDDIDSFFRKKLTMQPVKEDLVPIVNNTKPQVKNVDQ
jgi:hypothetical protein